MPTALFAIGGVLAFVYGTVVGSFLNVCIYRLPRGESLLHPPSHCPRCSTRLRPADLFPLLSYLALGRKCRYCRTRISPRYFVIELCTGLLFLACWVALAHRYQEGLISLGGLALLVLACVFVAAMLVTFVIDLDTTYVFEPVTWVAMGAGVLFEITAALMAGREIAFTVGGAAVPYLPAAVPGMLVGFLLFIAMDIFGGLIFRKPSMGLGDAYIGAAIGAMLGPALALLSFGMAVLVGAVVGIIVLIAASLAARKRAKARGARRAPDAEPEAPAHRTPIVPFLVTLAAFAVLWGVLSYAGFLLRVQLGALSPAAGALIALLFAAAVVLLLVGLGRLWPAQEVEDESIIGLQTGNHEDEEGAQARYMPFGPFLTASAVIVALAPDWFLAKASEFFHWWFYRNPWM